MKTGHELDVLVARKVMGLKDVWHPFFPSTEIADAWKVVEKLRENYEVDMFDMQDHWHVDVSDKDWMSGGWSGSSENESLPLAICLAALEAVGVEVE
ncbi:hypothetical protein BEP19_09920 [Ammoniphilus oxalaticus]|uniref:Phage ABA sandwich domain-containing protein n=1 Tax=Ammoniphilus oxalaticus TaxID=66863 RepID=A0A419SFL2_9BACL|nr:hypothetical protein [Ammoniphilus oxalaticus]RKD22568.1 hypothetical protein BEP19_09920 [Ammoniphilus oxalaticus]